MYAKIAGKRGSRLIKDNPRIILILYKNKK